MCGINGIVTKSLKINVRDIVSTMNNEIIHRGPDDDGLYTYNSGNVNVAIGMRRLSIIDVNSGSQPIISADKNFIIVFNGEIYNYKVLKEKLKISHDIKFKTNSDTEVILKLYECHGIKSFGMLDGMFSFSIIDKTKNKIYIARDFFGEKPLYYTKTNDSILWSSELKSIVKTKQQKLRISKKALSIYFQLTFIPSPYSIYEEVFKLQPNHYLELDLSSLDFAISPILQNLSKENYSDITFKDAKKINHDLVIKSVESRSISDVPIGTFLSGGVDSSIVSLCLSKINDNPIDTFSMGFEKKSFDESEKSQLVAKLIGSKHHEFIVSNDNMESFSNELILNYDEPFADSSALPTYLISKLTRNSVKVALTGDGGDEVYGGYNKYYIGFLNQKYKNIIPESIHDKFLSFSDLLTKSNNDKRGLRYKFRRLLDSISYEEDFYLNIISLGFQNRELNKLFNNNYLLENTLNDLIRFPAKTLTDFRKVDKNISLEGDMLVKVERASMLASLECRSPFLNKEIWDFSNNIPENYLMNGFEKKILLKESFKQYFPENFLNKSKKGFQVPVGDWLKTIFKNELLSYIESVFLKEQDIFHIPYIHKLVNEHISGKLDNTFRVWTFYCFQKWYKNTFSKVTR
jgi:asparagine synthase (glutamine-hydrolysing)